LNIREKSAHIKKIWQGFVRTDAGKRTCRRLGHLLTLGFVVYLALQVREMGWARVWSSLPGTPWFYVTFLGIYFNLTAFETIIYGKMWKQPLRMSIPVLIKKRVYSKDVLGYSGEAYLYLWARKRVDLPDRQILHSLKDNVIISSVASTVVGVGVIALLFFSGRLPLPETMIRHAETCIAVTLGVCGAAGALGVAFRRNILHLPPHLIQTLFGLHTARALVALGLQVLQWTVVIPDVPLSTWLILLSAQIIVTRIPLVPNRGLLFAGTSLGLSGFVHIPPVQLAAMLLTSSVLDKVLNLALFTTFSVLKNEKESPESPDIGQPPAPWAESPGFLSPGNRS
jgi:hypothetical protein